MTKLIPLADAVSRFVRPGMHLNFASTPSRSNASIRQIARQFHDRDPRFVLSATGFHSTLHLLGMLRLGIRYIGCFFGDNYPTPRPNQLYRELLREGTELEHWSLLTYVSALRAAALGHPYALTHSLVGTDLGEQLSRAGKFLELERSAHTEAAVGQVSALTPDLVFLHAAAADEAGNAAFFPPYCEGFHGAFAARAGVIITAERILPAASLRRVPELVPLAPERVLAVCEAPFGAHPQPLHFPSEALPVQSYRDDFEHYELWRQLSVDSNRGRQFVKGVLLAPDGDAAYEQFVGGARLTALRVSAGARPLAKREPGSSASLGLTSSDALTSAERIVLLAARVILRRASAAGVGSVLAGIGQAFAAARLASVLARAAEIPLEMAVETGMSGVDPWRCHPFLLSQQTIASAARLSSVETVLGALTCGATNRCLGVLGAAQVDETGNLNSSFSRGELLVGSGGANDIASSASEVVVLCPADRKRLVRRVEFVTSPGRRVHAIVTDHGVLERASTDSPWLLGDTLDAPNVAARALRERTDFEFSVSELPSPCLQPSPGELRFLGHLRSEQPSPARNAEHAPYSPHCSTETPP